MCQRKGKLRKHQRVWNYIQQRKASGLVASFSIISLLGVCFFLGPAQSTNVKRVYTQSHAPCSSCSSHYQLSANTADQARLKFIHQTAPVSITHANAAPMIAAPQSTPATPLPTQGPVNVFPYGTCTWWANQRYHQLHGIFVPWRTQANAWQWTARAYQFGWHVSSSPVVGAIIDLQPGVQGASWAGHVAVVEKILRNGHVITSNMNWSASPGQVTYVEFTPGPGVTFIYR